MKINLKFFTEKIKKSSIWLKFLSWLTLTGWLVFIVIVLLIAFATYQDVYKVIISEPDTGRVSNDVQKLRLKKNEFEQIKTEIIARQERINTETVKEFINPFSLY